MLRVESNVELSNVNVACAGQDDVVHEGLLVAALGCWREVDEEVWMLMRSEQMVT